MCCDGAAFGANRDVGLRVSDQVAVPLWVFVAASRGRDDDDVGPVSHVDQWRGERLACFSPAVVHQQRRSWFTKSGPDPQVLPQSASARAVDEGVEWGDRTSVG